MHEIYAFKYAGPFTSSGAFLMWAKEWDKVEKRNYYIWCIKGSEGPVVVDTGVSPGLAAERNLVNYISPSEILRRIDVDADEVQHVIITHIHWDHASGMELFPKARFYLQEREFAFWLRNPIAKRPCFAHVSDERTNTFIASLEGTDRLQLLDGDTEILPGIECLFSPGHTPGLQSVAVNVKEGTAILGSDCGHLFRNYTEDWPTVLITDLVAWMETYDRLRARASSSKLLFPGHDPLMTEGYPSVGEGVTRLA